MNEACYGGRYGSLIDSIPVLVARLGRVSLRSIQQLSTPEQGFSKLLTGIDADTETSQREVAVAINTGIISPQVAEDGVNGTDTISRKSSPGAPKLLRTHQLSRPCTYVAQEAVMKYTSEKDLPQVTHQNTTTNFASSGVPFNNDGSAVTENTENLQQFDAQAFTDGLFEFDVPMSLQGYRIRWDDTNERDVTTNSTLYR